MASGSTTIYSGWGWDEVISTAVLATVLLRKGYRVYIEFPQPSEKKGLLISRSYAVGITHKDGAVISDSTAIDYIPEKKLGIVIRYDGEGKGDVVMRFSNVASLTESMLEYVQTLNEEIKLPEQLLKDLELMNRGGGEKLSKVGRTLLKALKMNYSSKDFRKVMYSFALDVIKSRSLRIPEEIAREAEKYDEAVGLAEKIIEEKQFIPYGKLKVIVISSKFSRDFIRNNYGLFKPIAYDILTKVCRNDGVAVLVQETELGHVIRVCLRTTEVSFVKVISSIPEELSERLLITLRGNHIIIKFKDPSESSLDKALELVERIGTTISTALEGKRNVERGKQ
ncbi:MAG: hypothetical protein J7L55_01160 [Desulfurococcales archaeon]|nr:hypothetical protein [Desulfurococcales archaeon]